MRLVDHHCHGVSPADLDRSTFESMLTEAESISPWGTTLFDSMIGLAVRRWCAPVLDLPEHVRPDEYLARRSDLGAAEVNRRFLRAAGVQRYLVDEGFRSAELTSAADLGMLAVTAAHPIVRLERVAEDVVAAGTSAVGFAEAVTAALARHSTSAVGCKSIAAYRVGLALSGQRPSDGEVRMAAERWLTAVERGAPVRLADEALHRYLVWQAVDLRLPIQFHVGYGDVDADLHRCDPLLLTGLLRATRHTGVPVSLLHNYPFHRQAGYLAQVFDHVFVDIGLAVPAVGRRAGALIAETLEIAPFGKVLFSSDGCGLAELHYLGAVLFRRGLSDFLRDGLDDGTWSMDDVVRIAQLVTAENAGRVYGLDLR